MALKLIRNVCILCTVRMFLYFVWMNLWLALTKCSTCNTSWENNSRWKHISMLARFFFFACLPSFCLWIWWKIIWKLETEPNRRRRWRNKKLYYTHKNYVNVMSNIWERKIKKNWMKICFNVLLSIECFAIEDDKKTESSSHPVEFQYNMFLRETVK